MSLPKAAPVIRNKAVVPRPSYRVRADGTEEILAEDILLIVPPAEAFRPPTVSVHATQEILADDVLEVADQPIPDERPSTVPPPWTMDANPMDEFEFPSPPHFSAPYAAISRITTFSATQVFRRRSANLKVVIASVACAASVMIVAGIARFAPPSGAASEGPIGIAMHTPKKLDKTVRTRTLAYGSAPHVNEAVSVSIDSLPLRSSRAHRR